MKDKSFQEIQEVINGILLKKLLKPALNIEIKASLHKEDAYDFFIISVYQQEKNSNDHRIFHAFDCKRLADLKYKFQLSVDKENQQETFLTNKLKERYSGMNLDEFMNKVSIKKK